MNTLLERLLDYYGLTEEEYGRMILPPSFQNLPKIDSSPLTIAAIKRLDQAKEKGEKVLVYGDYDTDGIMSCSIILSSLREYGLLAEGYLPSRYLDGYGITKENVDKIASNGYSLIFTVDNGVSAFEALDEAKRKGIDVIILDHHEFQDKKPDVITLHPDLLSYGDVPVSAGYLSFIFSCALLHKKDDYLMSLGAISTLSDMMPLKGYNREIVRLALLSIKENRYPEIYALTDKKFIDEKILQMEIIPKINAVGRMLEGKEINRLLRYFIGGQPKEKRAISEWLSEVNAKRKEETKAAESKVSVDPNDEAIVVLCDIPEGLNGLLANRLLNEYEKPVAVFSPMKGSDDVLVGSLRSKEGFNILKAISSDKINLLSGGGHAFAGGVSIKKSDFESFKKEFIFAALKHKFSPDKKKLIPLNLSEATMENANLVATFSPFGQEWGAPSFLLSKLDSKEFTYTSNGKYLSYRLPNGVRLFSFSISEDSFINDEKVDLAVSFSPNEFKGRMYLDLLAEKA